MDRVALIDADMLCYRIGFACDKEDASVATKTMDKFVTDLIGTLDVINWELFLTGKGNFRNEIAVTVPYKGNRAELKKPVHLETLRQFLVNNWDASVAEGQEADDAIAIRATQLGDDGIIVSLDKDFDQVQGWHYNFVKDEMYYVTAEEGLLNFYMQFLTGDRIDNIVGVKGIGPVKAHKLLTNAERDQYEMFAVCVEHLGYERAVENGRLLYLRREENELWNPPTKATSSSTVSSTNTTTETTPQSTKQEACS
jgi:hypothetical protein